MNTDSSTLVRSSLTHLSGATLALVVWCSTVIAADLPAALPGWVVARTPYSYDMLIERVDQAIAQSPLGKVTTASATVGARTLGREIPGNMVVGVFAPKFAVRMLEASVAAGIEAPLRLYLTENADGTSTLSYKTASHVFAPYEDGGEALRILAQELDAILEDIVDEVLDH